MGSSWFGYMTGRLEFSLKLHTEIAAALISDDSKKHVMFTGGN